jgi:hypothetical protein
VKGTKVVPVISKMIYSAGNCIATLSTRERSAVSLTPLMVRFPVPTEWETQFEILPMPLKTYTNIKKYLNRDKLITFNGPYNDKWSKS